MRMRFMEYFGFASGNSTTGPNFPFMAESVLKDYPAELTGHPALPSVSPYDFVSVDWSSLYHGLVDSYLSTFQSPLTRSIGAGVVAAAVIYCAWKVSVVWRDGINLGMFNEMDFEGSRAQQCKASDGSKPKERFQSPAPKAVIYEHNEEVVVCKNSAAAGTGDQPQLEMPATARSDEGRCIGAMELATVSETFQRQLIDAISKLDDVKYRLKELESEKELLFAEIDLRRKVTQKLQEENSSEREKRQHAELRMEMMEIENSQLRQLRKELALKSGQVERMEKFLKEKDDLQMKLFEDNVVLSRTVAEARAKEFGALQTRVHQLQSELDASKQMCHAGYTPALSILLAQEGGGAASQAPKISEVPRTSSNIVPNNAPLVLVESSRKRVANMNRRFADKSPRPNRTSSPPRSPRYSRSNTSPELTTRTKVPQHQARGNGEICNRICNNIKPVTNFHRPTSSTMSAPHGANISLDLTSNKNTGVFSQIRALIGGFRESSSESDFASPSTPSLLIGDLDTRKKDANNDNNNLVKNDEYPLSDEHSSVFMSASGGSCASNTERHRNPVLGINKLTGKKPLHVKRLSKCKRDKRRDKDRLSKRKIAAHFAAGQDTVTNIKELSTPCSDSSDKSQKSTVKNFSVVAKTSKCQVSGRCSTDGHESRASTPDSYDDNDVDSGDSWIVILPAAS